LVGAAAEWLGPLGALELLFFLGAGRARRRLGIGTGLIVGELFFLLFKIILVIGF
jgi:hypothetical protein